LNLGLDAEEMVILLLTLIASTLTFVHGRATILQGVVHLVIFRRLPAAGGGSLAGC